MNNFGIVETVVYVICPHDSQKRKVYARSIPEKNAHICNGCDFLNGSKECDNCICTVIRNLQNGKITTSDQLFIDPLSDQHPRESIGTFSNPLLLK